MKKENQSEPVSAMKPAWKKHMELLSDIHTPAAEAICHYFEYWSPDAARPVY